MGKQDGANFIHSVYFQANLQRMSFAPIMYTKSSLKLSESFLRVDLLNTSLGNAYGN